MADRYVHVAADHTVAVDDSITVYNEAGVLQWKDAIALYGEAGAALAVAVNAAGEVFVGSEYYDESAQKYTVAGALVWSESPWDESMRAIAVTPTGDALVGGAMQSTGAHLSVAVMSGTDGSTVWGASTGGGVNAVAVDKNGICYAAGVRVGSLSIWSYAADGTPGWTADYGANVFAIALDQTGSYLYVAGRHNSLACVRKFYTPTGAEVTTGGFPLEYDATDFIQNTVAICLDRFDNIYVAYEDDALGKQFSKYSSAGVLLWSQTYDNAQYPTGIAVTPEGNVYVVGGEAEGSEIFIKRYNGTTGAEETGAGWPVSTGQDEYGGYIGAYAVAVSPGLIGTFPSAWLPPPNIYVGDVDFE